MTDDLTRWENLTAPKAEMELRAAQHEIAHRDVDEYED